MELGNKDSLLEFWKEKEDEEYSKLTDDQKIALKYLNSGENLFLTGNAGTGKSFLSEYFINRNIGRILVCAPTGIAALNVGGTTIHSAFKIFNFGPLCAENPTKVPDVVREADIILIDEISMCRLDLFNYIVKILKVKEESFGKHTQLVLVGDALQLPPVVTPGDREVLKEYYPSCWWEPYFFYSEYWDELNFKCVNLKTVVRQKDPEFVKNLNKIRIGDRTGIDYFNVNCVGNVVKDAIYLTPRNAEVEEINKQKLSEIDRKEEIIRSKVEGNVYKSEKPTDDNLILKVGARVMCLVNNNQEGYVNGSFGTVTYINNSYKPYVTVAIDDLGGREVDIGMYDFKFYDYKVIKKKENNKEVSEVGLEERGVFRQIPLKLAYAVTIHKSQGQTYDKVVINPSVFAEGQTYVAMSRCRCISGIELTRPIQFSEVRANTGVMYFYNKCFGNEVLYEQV